MLLKLWAQTTFLRDIFQRGYILLVPVSFLKLILTKRRIGNYLSLIDNLINNI